jgi:hypothetical protein
LDVEEAICLRMHPFLLHQELVDQVQLENAERAALGTEKTYDRSIP